MQIKTFSSSNKKKITKETVASRSESERKKTYKRYIFLFVVSIMRIYNELINFQK